MSEDKIPNDDMNNRDIPDFSNDLNARNPENTSGGAPAPETPAPEAEIPLSQDSPLPQEPKNYEFENVYKDDSSEEVHIEQGKNYDEPVTVRPVEFAPFDSYTPTNTDTNRNLELLMDIKLELTVELGRCHLPVKKVLELTRGSIIELDKVAGESVELYANGKHVANGEVVVIEDNFGLRITSITDPEERIKSL